MIELLFSIQKQDLQFSRNSDMDNEEPQKRKKGRPRTNFNTKEQIDVNGMTDAELERIYSDLKSQYEANCYFTDVNGKTWDVGVFSMMKHREAKRNSTKYELPIELNSKLSERNRLTKVMATYKHALEQRVISKDLEVLSIHYSKIIDLYSKGHSTREIHEVLLENIQSRSLSYNTLEAFKDRNQVDISNKAKLYQDNLDDVPLTKKRRRLEVLQDLYHKWNKQLKESPNIQFSQEIRAILRQIKEECDGLVLKVEMDIKHAIDLHISQDEIVGVNPLQIILANLAGKMGVNPIWFQTRLAQSYYAKINGFINPNIKQDYDGEFVFPSDILYDFDKLEGKAKEVYDDDNKNMYLVNKKNEVTEEEANSIIGIKDAFLESLRRRLGK